MTLRTTGGGGGVGAFSSESVGIIIKAFSGNQSSIHVHVSTLKFR